MHIKVNSKLVAVVEGESLMTTLIHYNQDVANICNGQGTCGKCKVKILNVVPEPSDREYQKLSSGELAAGVRLACLVQPCEGMEIVCDTIGIIDRKQELLFTDEQTCSGQQSGVSQISVHLDRPSLQDERGDWDRLSQKLHEICPQINPTLGLPQLQNLAPLLRQDDFSVSVVLWKNQILAIRPGQKSVPVYGVAIDIGTTNIAVALYDLETGRMLRLAATENSQTAFGADVISRIEFANHGQENRNLLRQAVLNSINGLLNQLSSEAGINTDDIFKAVVVGNTTMHHLFLGLDVSYLAVSPFVSVCNEQLELNAVDTGLVLHPQGKVFLFPNVGGFVGGDTLGDVLGAENLLANGCHLLIDIGTNCELYLQDGSRMWACSTAAGPAFEGAGITYGMRAQTGSIERVMIDEKKVTVSVIGGGEALGICGSGLIEAIQQMRRAGIINQQGTIIDPNNPEESANLAVELKERIRARQRSREFVLSYSSSGDDIVLTQQDISQLQLAKGAVCAGIRTLLDIAGLAVTDLDTVVLSGTFASHLNLASTVDIGLIPQMSLHKLKTAGNAAHAGAVKVLVDQGAFERLRRKADHIIHVELGGSSIFSGYFMESMYIEPYKI